MKISGSYKRYDILKKRYEHVKKEQAFYSELLNSNIFIIAPVGAGKNVLMEGLAERLPFNGIDMGKIFRMASFALLNDSDVNAVNPNMDLLDQGDVGEFDRVMGAISRRKKFLKEELLDKTSMSKDANGKFTLQYQGTDYHDELESDEVTRFVATASKSPVVRETVWRWVKKAANDIASEKQNGIFY
ncbi:MAG: (d)CMP kinase [Candidatus Levyibacteriota bacterium]